MKLRPNTHLYTDNEIAWKRPQCAIMIGAITMAWSSLENTLTNQYVLLVDAMFGIGLGTATDLISRETFESIEVFRTKKEVLLRAARQRFATGLVSQYEDHISKVDKAHQLRNRIVHGNWFISNSYPDAIICARRISEIREARAYTPRMLGDLVNSINKAHDGVEVFFRSSLVPLLKQEGRSLVQWVSATQIPD